MKMSALVDRPEGSPPTIPPGQFSEQGRLVAVVAPIRAQNIGNPALIGAQHCGDVLHLVPIPAQKPHSLGLGVVKVGAMNLDMVQNNPGHGVSECSHGFLPYWLHRGRRFYSGVTASPGGGSFPRIASFLINTFLHVGVTSGTSHCMLCCAAANAPRVKRSGVKQ